MEAVFHLKIPFDNRCIFAQLYEVKKSPQLVAVSVHNKTVNEKNPNKLVEFVSQIKECNPPQKTAAQIEEERKLAEKARISNERANAFLRNRNNA